MLVLLRVLELSLLVREELVAMNVALGGGIDRKPSTTEAADINNEPDATARSQTKNVAIVDY